ncbi:MAG: hypothetical protein HC817_05880 [Saprospiraceae bacterium]|nr:hypothetical protein [Saprospiraceae bacterium]
MWNVSRTTLCNSFFRLNTLVKFKRFLDIFILEINTPLSIGRRNKGVFTATPNC